MTLTAPTIVKSAVPPVSTYQVALPFSSAIIDFETLGGLGDGDYRTATGSDNAAAFAFARLVGLHGCAIRFRARAQYRTTEEILLHDGMTWIGDDGHTPVIFGDFAVPGNVIAKSPPSGWPLQNVSINGLTFARVGRNPEHGLLLDNLDGAKLDVSVLADEAAIGGAIGISAFYPENRPSRDVHVRARLITWGGNFGIQFGNVDGGSIQLDRAEKCMREVIGLEPYALGKCDFSAGEVRRDVIAWPAHGITTGHPLIYAAQGNEPIASLAARTAYYFAVPVDADHIQLAATKEKALAGTVLAITFPKPTGIHRLMKCGVLRDVMVHSSVIDTGDVPVRGSKTGIVIITSSSGGYHEGVKILSQTIIDHNQMSGSCGFGIFGAHNTDIFGGEVSGARVRAVSVDTATLNGIRDVTGEITPDPTVRVISDCRITNVKGRAFGVAGLEVVAGRAIVQACDMRSTVMGATGFIISAEAEAAGTIVTDCVAEIQNGTAFVVQNGTNNRDLALPEIEGPERNEYEE